MRHDENHACATPIYLQGLTVSFENFNFDSRIATVIKTQRFEQPTPIQAQAIPSILAGSDVMGLAQTGTGKTAAFVLPMLQRLSQSQRRGVRALILAPTRELAQQIEEVVYTFARPLGLRSMTAFGGVSMNNQINELKRGVSIVVGCPGRILDHIQQRTIDLSQIEFLVLDEADHMFDMGFLPTIRRILRTLPTQRQTLLFSATMPTDIRALASETLKNPKTIQVGQSAPVSTVAHALYHTQQEFKSQLLLELLKTLDSESVLVFTRTKHRAKRLGKQLSTSGFKATSLQGNMSQNQREQSMSGFRNGKYQILVATDIAARGIDISSVSHVINFDIPDTVEAYTHRIGRTGRAARSGDAFTFVTREDNGMVRSIERMLGSRIPVKTLAGFTPQALPQTSDLDRRVQRHHRHPRSEGNQRGGMNERQHRHPRRQSGRSMNHAA